MQNICLHKKCAKSQWLSCHVARCLLPEFEPSKNHFFGLDSSRGHWLLSKSFQPKYPIKTNLFRSNNIFSVTELMLWLINTERRGRLLSENETKRKFSPALFVIFVPFWLLWGFRYKRPRCNINKKLLSIAIGKIFFSSFHLTHLTLSCNLTRSKRWILAHYMFN